MQLINPNFEQQQKAIVTLEELRSPKLIHISNQLTG